MKRMRRIGALLLLCFMMAAMLLISAQAAEKPDLEEPCSLTVVYDYGGIAVPYAHFSLYYIASMDENLSFTIAEKFASYRIQTEGLDQQGWQALAVTLAGYIQRDGIEPVLRGGTNERGIWKSDKNLKAGLYLLLGEETVDSGYRYTTAPAMLVLPERTSAGTWLYESQIKPKLERERIDTPPPITRLTRRVLKIWEDKGLEAWRPEEIEAQLLRDGKVYATVTLNEDNNWRHEWTGLSSGYSWTVVEKEVPEGYTVKIDQKGITYTITNTAEPCEIDPPVKKIITGDKPETDATFRFVMEAISNTAGYSIEEMPMPEGTENGKKTKDIRGAQEFEFGIIRYTRAGIYVYRIYEEDTGAAGYTYDKTVYTITCVVTEKNGKLSAVKTTSADEREAEEVVFTNHYQKTDTPPTDPGKPSDPGKPTDPGKPGQPQLPQTGQLWWPVPILFLLGIILVVLGAVQRGSKRHEG